MGYRSFTDSRGIAWQTWDVVPRLADRRVAARRTPAAQPVHSERRLRVDRRVVDGVRPSLSPALGLGWLCFESSYEKRRLTPIPGDWLTCALTSLEQYCSAALRAIRPSPSLRPDF